MKRRLRVLAALVLVASIVLAGCSGSSSDSGGAPLTDADVSVEQATADSSSGGTADYQGEELEFQGATNRQEAVLQRSLIVTGKIRLEVEKYTAARKRIVEAARTKGGYVSASQTQLHREGNRTWQTGFVELRVPNEDFSSLQSDVEAVGTVVSSSSDSQDVTDQLVDLDARLKNLRSQRDRLRHLYEKANETEAVLDVQERLSEVQSEIERLEAKEQTLQNRVAYSTITVSLAESRPGESSVVDRHAWYQNGVLDAFLASVAGVGTLLRALVVGLAYALPYLAVFAIPVGGLLFAFTRRS